MNWLKKHGTFEKLLGKKHKVSIGQAFGVAKSEAKARELCEDAAADILQNSKMPTFEVRDGFLIGSGIESSTSAWYFIKSLDDLQDGDALTKLVFPQCFLHPKKLKEAIASHLAGLVADRDGGMKVKGAELWIIDGPAARKLAGLRTISQTNSTGGLQEVRIKCELNPQDSDAKRIQNLLLKTNPDSPGRFQLRLSTFTTDDTFSFSAFIDDYVIDSEPLIEVATITLHVIGDLSIDISAGNMERIIRRRRR